ncbi:MAG: aminotransferase class IV [Chitinophagaceae bacterium]
MPFIYFNNRFIPAGEPVLPASNKSFRYGDGLFETIKVAGGKLLLGELHFDRLFSGLSQLKIALPALVNRQKMSGEIMALCQKNKCSERARVRLTVFRGNGGLYEENKDAGYLIECWPLEKEMDELNQNGLVLDIFPHGRKSQDPLSGLKSSSALIYALAAQYAREQKLNDCLVLNTTGHIADSTIANIFLVKNSKVQTPALSEGCIAGVMRRHLLQSLQNAGMDVEETVVSPDDLSTADEVFLTNAIRGIRWVRSFREKEYTCGKTVRIFDQFVQTISG